MRCSVCKISISFLRNEHNLSMRSLRSGNSRIACRSSNERFRYAQQWYQQYNPYLAGVFTFAIRSDGILSFNCE